MSVSPRLPPLEKRITQVASGHLWTIDDKAPQLGACVPCKGRGRFVWRAWHNIRLECEACKGTGNA